MCGIWFFLSITKPIDTFINYSNNIKHRGPDYSTHLTKFNFHAVFHRLSIIDVNHGSQPFIFYDNKHFIMVMCNGEIYNYKELYASLSSYNISKKTNSDCEVILHLYLHFGYSFVNYLNGEFAFCIFDFNYIDNSWELLYGRDRFGIRPLFISSFNSNDIILSSELKGCPHADIIMQVPPRKLFSINNSFKKSIFEYYNLNSIIPFLSDKFEILPLIKHNLIKSVTDRLMSERPFGCFLSGGLDSSLVAGIVAQWCISHNMILYTFSIGMDGSTDEVFAKQVSQYINSIHTHVKFTPLEFFNAIPDVIKSIETYDITTIRASVGQYLLAKYIAENTDIKVIIIGDGADELCGGYRYLYNAPNPDAFNDECISLLNNIHFFDVLRADRGISAHGLEARVPFLDNEFVSFYLSIIPELRKPINGIYLEKKLLRDAFMDANIIPFNVLYRKKEAFSDGVSSPDNSWHTIIQSFVNDKYSNDDLKNNKYITNHPMTKEALYYRDLFTQFYPNYENDLLGHSLLVPHFWLPKWNGSIVDPSARVLSNY